MYGEKRDYRESFVSHFVASWNLLTGKGGTHKINDIPAYIRVE